MLRSAAAGRSSEVQQRALDAVAHERLGEQPLGLRPGAPAGGAGVARRVASVRSIAPAIPSTSPGASTAQTSGETPSLAPTSLVATTGTPAARASETVSPKGS